MTHSKDLKSLELSPHNSKKCPFHVTRAGCYHSENRTSNTITKGCVSELSALDLDFLQTNNKVSICSGDNCNSKINVLSCVTCQSNIYSKDNAKCLSTLDNVGVESCAGDNDVCYTHVSLWDVKRGCLSEAPENVRADCDAKNGHCELCDDIDGCNKRLHDYEVCYQMDHNTTAPIPYSPKHYKRCYLKTVGEGCYHYDDPWKQSVKKGCVADLTEMERATYTESKRFETCRNYLCNSQKPVMSCLTCKSTGSSYDCAINLKNVEHNVCDSRFDECYVHSDDGVIFERGCLANATSEIQSKCIPNGRTCTTCDGFVNCNKQVYEPEICHSTNYINGDAKECNFSIFPMGCYHFVNGETGHVERGCVSDLSNEQVEIYSKQRPNYHTCKGHKCNKKESLPACLTCTSNESGDHCTSNFSTVALETCNNYDDVCYTRLNGNNRFERGCLSSISQSESKDCNIGKNCEVCRYGNGCNNRKKFNERCHTLNRYNNLETIAPKKSVSEECPPTWAPKGCYHFENRGTNFVGKGCVASLNTELFDWMVTQGVKICHGSNCNDGEQIQSCFMCSSNYQDDACDADFSKASVKACDKYEDKCYTHVTMRSVERGCLGEASNEVINACGSSDGKCDVCEGEALCNSLSILFDYCSVGAYKTNELVDKWSSKKCLRQMDGEEGCYLYENSEQEIIEKGCVSELSAAKLSSYVDQPNMFKICYGKNCNDGGEGEGAIVASPDDIQDSGDSGDDTSNNQDSGDNTMLIVAIVLVSLAVIVCLGVGFFMFRHKIGCLKKQ